MRLLLGFLGLILVSVSVHAQDAVKRDQHQMHQLHRDPMSYIGALEDPKRDAYQKPHEVLTALKIKSGEVIADIGAVYFSFRFAHSNSFRLTNIPRPGDNRFIHQRTFHQPGTMMMALFLATARRTF